MARGMSERPYLIALRDACAARPGLHRHQLAALDAGAGPGPELAQAATLDRLASAVAVALAVGDPWGASAAAATYVAETRGKHIAPAVAPGAPSAFVRLVLALLAPRDAERARLELDFLLGADPAFAPGRTPYAVRLPWAGAEAVLEAWIGPYEPAAPPDDNPEATIAAAGEAWRASLSPAPVPPPTGAAGAAYRAMAESLDGEARAAAEALAAAAEASTDEPPPAWFADRLLARFAAAPLRERAQASLARQAFWPDPLTAAHWRGLLDALDDARTPTDVEAAAGHAAACLAVEGDWNVLAHGLLTAPLVAALEHDLEPGPDRAAHARAVAASAFELTGLGPRAALAHPRVTRLLTAQINDQGAEDGEAGFDLVAILRGWRELTGGGDVAAALDRAGVPEPAADPRPETRWGAVGGQRPALPGSLP
jgi:hypothetical protein